MLSPIYIYIYAITCHYNDCMAVCALVVKSQQVGSLESTWLFRDK